MPITSEQREQRRGFLGSSDMAAILGLDPYRTALDVYASKVFELEEREDSEAIELGNTFEAPLLFWAARKLGASFVENVRTVSGIFASNHDGLLLESDTFAPVGCAADLSKPPIELSVTYRKEGLEAKVRTFDPSEFGEEGTDQIPPRVICQTQVQCLTGGLERVYVPVMLPWHGRLSRRLYKVERSESVIAHVRAVGEAFWRDHVLAKVPPAGVSGSIEVWKRIVREPNSIATVPAELVERWEACKLAEREAEKAKDAAFVELLAQVGEAEAWEWGAEDGTFYTYYAYVREIVDGKRLKAERPDIAEQYVKESVYRTAYRKSPKKGRK